jgi:predicted phosphodiesterase
MIIGCMGDTHDVDKSYSSKTVNEFINRKVQVIVHTGDIESHHIDPELYAGLPVICVLTKMQAYDANFSFSPNNWRFVRPGYNKDEPKFVGNFTDPRANEVLAELAQLFQLQKIHCRIVPIKIGNEAVMAYCGHERSFDVYTDPQKVRNFFTEINQVYDGVRLAVTGHMHRQFVWRHGSLTWVMPGSVLESLNKTHEFATVDTSNWEVVLGRLCNTEAKLKPVTVGIVSDTGNIDDLDCHFWEKLKKEFNFRDASHIICCGYFHPSDIGRPEFADKQVYYYLLPEFADYSVGNYLNWHRLPYDNPVVDICGHLFYVQHDIGPEQADLSDAGRHNAFIDIRNRYKRLDYIVSGLVPDTIVQEDGNSFFINPGDAKEHRNFSTVCLPRGELTISPVPN